MLELHGQKLHLRQLTKNAFAAADPAGCRLPVKTGPIFGERVRQLERWNVTDRTPRVTKPAAGLKPRAKDAKSCGLGQSLTNACASWSGWNVNRPHAARNRGRLAQSAPTRRKPTDWGQRTGPIFDERVRQPERCCGAEAPR